MLKSIYSFFIVLFITGLVFVGLDSKASDEPKSTFKTTAFSAPIIDDSTLAYLHRFESNFESEMMKRSIPGAAIVIVKDSTIIYQKGFGVKVKGSLDSVNVNTVFRLGSVSKGFASILAGTLVEDELLNWETPIRNYIPEFELSDSAQTERVQIKHILSHTSGLPRHAYTNLVEDGLSIDRIIPRFKEVGLISEEGVLLSYQNAAYTVIEKVIEKQTQKSFEEELTEQLFKPLGMENASASYKSLIDNKNKAMPHKFHSTRKGMVPTPISKKYYNAISAGGINASIKDMGQWLLMLTGNHPEVIADSTLDRIFSPIANINNNRYSTYWDGVNKSQYGMGWRMLDNHGQNIVYHGGFVNGFRSEIAFDKKNKIGICILVNAPSGYALQVIPAFFNEFSAKSLSEVHPIYETK